MNLGSHSYGSRCIADFQFGIFVHSDFDTIDMAMLSTLVEIFSLLGVPLK